MKNLLFGMMALVVSFSGVAQAAGHERVLVKKVEMTGDFMPRIGIPGFPVGGLDRPFTVITAQVDSNGCTDESSFRVDARRVAQGVQLTIVRIRPDHCRAFFPEGTEVQLTTPVVGFGDQVFIGNPVRVTDSTTH